MLIEMTEPNFSHKDGRGSIVQLVRYGFNQINVITSKANSFRGGHYHCFNREAFYIISGKLKLTVQKDNMAETREFSAGDMFAIQPYISHNFFYITDTVLISMYDQGIEMENGEKDIIEGDKTV